MRPLLLILILSSIVPSFAQTEKIFNYTDLNYCTLVVDSLIKIGYFKKAQQINLKEVPIKANISIYRGSGCLVSSHNSFEFIYSDNMGYILTSRTRFKDEYLKFSNPSVLIDLFSALNQNYLVDSTLLIKNPNHRYTSGEGGMVININIEFPSGITIKKHLSYPWSPRAYCTYKYFEKFYQYLNNLHNLSFKPLDYCMAYYLNKNFTSEISRLYVNEFDNTFQKMEPLPAFSTYKIEIIHKIEK